MLKKLLILTCFAIVGARADSKGDSNAQIYNGQTTASGSAVQLNSGTSRPLKTICIKALHANGSAVYLGGSSSVASGNGMELIADQSWCANITDANLVWVNGTGTVSWIGTN